MKSLVCIGDSLVEGEGDKACLGGWVGRLQQKLAPNIGMNQPGWRTFNLGIGGHHILDIYHRLQEVRERSPDVVILGCGANDVKRYVQPDGTTQLAIATFQAQRAWEGVLAALKQTGAQVFVCGPLQGSTPAGPSETRRVDPAEYTAHFAWLAAQAKVYGATMLPSVGLAGDQFSHGLHPNDAGYDAIADTYWKALQKQKVFA